MKHWKKEIERKYKLPVSAVIGLKETALDNGFVVDDLCLQRDWIPDFEGGITKNSDVLLRIRKTKDLETGKQGWALTLKRRFVKNGTHLNEELEISDHDLTSCDAIREFLEAVTHRKLDLQLIVDGDKAYIESIGLTELRMLSEKKRLNLTHDSGVTLSIDEFPDPLGFYAELEVSDTEEHLLEWEALLGLGALEVEQRNYGRLIKDLAQSRKLTFE